ncbi:CDP-alcohol phosphatidyltransferase family protein [Candidatus Peregrinibacteria bacterium]|nr:CDP-alcohol phosphatidyltransferase family protein [Candidatus Peregrinibacteria bacterium]
MKLNIFSKEEEHYYRAFQKFRDDLFLPVSKQLAAKGVKPDHLSYLGVLLIIPFVFFFASNPWLSAICLTLNVLLDCLDGPLARYTHTASDRGALVDLICDYGSFSAVFITIAYYGLMTPFWAALYFVQYALMLYLVTYCRRKNIRFFPVVRSKYYLYLMLLWLLVTGLNWFDPFLVLFGVYMTATNIFLFDSIRCSKRS